MADHYRWLLPTPQPELAARLAAELSLSPMLAQCLVNRGLAEPAAAMAFLEPRLKYLQDPFRLPHMRQAVARLYQARERGEPLVVFGDFDVDGVTSTALLVEVLKALGWAVNFYLPGRFDEGYGLSREGVGHCLEEFPVKLLVAVDCGSTAVDTIRWLREQGVEVIVLDHHQISNPPPQAMALVNPRLGTYGGEPGTAGEKGSTAGCELSAVGIAFKLAHALVKHGRELDLAAAQQFDVRELLDLAALGTVADLVPLIGENRILVAAGLRRLQTTRRPGLQALKTVAQIAGTVGVYEVGFLLGPRLNAAGRLEDAADALRLLLTQDSGEAEQLALSLDARNRERQRIERSIAEEVIGALRARFDPRRDYVIVEGQLLWHIGVVGIVASRVLRVFHRPTIILGGDGENWRGSGRSIEGFDLAAALRECQDLLLRHGGHAMAAGVTLHPDKVDALRERLNELARRTLTPEQLQPSLRLDGDVSMADLTLERLEELDRLSPWGMGNPAVRWVLPNVWMQRPPQRMGKERQHAKWWISDGRDCLEAVLWNVGDAPVPSGSFDLAVEPQINPFNGRRSVQLKVLDWRAA